MSTRKRDKAILDLALKAYIFQFDYRERLDNKLNNFLTITGTIATLNVGIGFFVLGKIQLRNPFYPYLILTFLAGLGCLIFALLCGLLRYKPMEYNVYPENPEKIIAKYQNLTETHVIRESAASFALATNLNKSINWKKVEAINWLFLLEFIGISIMFAFAILMVFALGFPPIDP